MLRRKKPFSVIILFCLSFLFWVVCTDPEKPEFDQGAKLVDRQVSTHGSPVVDSTFLLYVSAEGSEPIQYQWYKDSVAMISSSDDTLVFSPLTLADTGSYFCIVKNDFGSDTSFVYALSVFTPPTIITTDKEIVKSPATPVPGDTVILSIKATGTDTLKYSWSLNGSLKTTDNDTLLIDSFSYADTGIYQCIVTNDYGVDSSKTCTLSVSQNQPPVVSNIPDQTIQKGGSFTIITLDDYVADPDNNDDQITWTASATTNITVTISADRKATITVNNADWIGSDTVIFTATDPGALYDTDTTIFTVSDGNLPPVVSDIPNQTVKKGSPFTVINLGDYVADPDNTDDQITWTTSATTNITVTISTDRKATVTANTPDWTGSEAVKFTAQDPGSLNDTNSATFTVTDNDPPVVSDIPDETVAEGGTFTVINLDDYVTDADNSDDEITWTASATTNLTVTINTTNRQATITVLDPEWNGSETVTFTATDPATLSNSDNVTFEVTAVNDTPVVSDIPNQTIAEGGSFPLIELDDFVADADNSDNEITWTASATTNITVTINASRQASIAVVDPQWNGSETVLFTAKDPGDMADTNYATFTVTSENDPPIVSNIPDQSVAEGGSFTLINLDDYVADADNSDDEITWTASATTNITVTINTTNRQATIAVVDPEWNGNETVTFTATDPTTLSNSDNVTFEVTAVNDPPVITGQTTLTINEESSQIVALTHLTIEDPDNTTFTGPFLSAGTNYTFSGTTVTPNDDHFGSLTVPVTVGDGTNTSDPFNLSITVNPVNDAPSFTKGADQSVDEDTGAQTVPDWATAISAGATNESSQALTFNCTSNNNALFSSQPSITSTGALSYTPADDANGSATVTVVLEDDGGTANGGVDTSTEQTFTITVDPVNDPPEITVSTTSNTVPFGDTALITYSYSDKEAGNLQKVELFLDGISVQVYNDVTNPGSQTYDWQLTALTLNPFRNYTFHAVATDSEGETGTSNSLIVSVAPSYISDTLSVRVILDANNITHAVDSFITLNTANRVDSLWGKHMVGFSINAIPPEIGNLTDLEYLWLPLRDMVSLRPEIGNLTKLVHLDLGGAFSYPNYLGKLASLPASIGNLTNLKKLIFRGHNLTDLPTEITAIEPDQECDFGYNWLDPSPDIVTWLNEYDGDWLDTQSKK